MFKALNLDPEKYSGRALSALEKVADVDSFYSDQILEEIIGCYDILLLRFSRKIDSELLSKAKRLKVIACNATGVDHIDTDACSQRGIKVLSLKGETEFLDSIHATAELSWGLLLSTVRKIPSAHNQIIKGEWDRDQFLTSELFGKTIGILGFGRIGKKIANYARAFGMEIKAYDPKVTDYPTYIQACSSLEDLVRSSDILSVHASYDSSTHHLVDSTLLALLPEGAIFINTARGGLVDEEALLSLLQSGHIGAAGLDVLNNENKPNFLNNNPLIDYARENENLVLVPHIGGVTKESWEKTELFMAQKIVTCLDDCEYEQTGN